MSWEIATGFIVVGIMFFFLHFANSLNGNEWFHRGVRLLLLCLSLFTAVIASNLALAHAQAASAGDMIVTSLESLYGILVYSTWLIVAMIVVYFIYEVIMSVKSFNSQKESEMLGK